MGRLSPFIAWLRHIFRHMGNRLNVNVPEVAREIFIQSLRKMNIQRSVESFPTG